MHGAESALHGSYGEEQDNQHCLKSMLAYMNVSNMGVAKKLDWLEVNRSDNVEYDKNFEKAVDAVKDLDRTRRQVIELREKIKYMQAQSLKQIKILMNNENEVKTMIKTKSEVLSSEKIAKVVPPHIRDFRMKNFMKIKKNNKNRVIQVDRNLQAKAGAYDTTKSLILQAVTLPEDWTVEGTLLLFVWCFNFESIKKFFEWSKLYKGVQNALLQNSFDPNDELTLRAKGKELVNNKKFQDGSPNLASVQELADSRLILVKLKTENGSHEGAVLKVNTKGEQTKMDALRREIDAHEGNLIRISEVEQLETDRQRWDQYKLHCLHMDDDVKGTDSHQLLADMKETHGREREQLTVVGVFTDDGNDLRWCQELYSVF